MTIPPQVVSQTDAVLSAGIDQIAAQQVITFTKYYRVVLPLDGYLFWVNAALVGDSAIPNVAQLNSITPNSPSSPGKQSTIKVQGSLHYDIERRQIEDQTYDINRVIFTAESPISDFDEVGPNCLFLGSFENPLASEGVIRFAFDRRQNFFQQSNKYHYVGDAVYPDMETQIIDDLNGFDTTNVIVSNSLPIWLGMNQMTPPYPYPPRQQVQLYPSFLVPDDVTPPYGVVHIYPEDTEALTSAPFISGETSSHFQLVKDRVKITFLGLRNFNILDFTDFVAELAAQYDAPFGIMNIPVPRDEKRNQDELSVIAMKKSVVYEINYTQKRLRDVAIQNILKVIPNYIIGAA